MDRILERAFSKAYGGQEQLASTSSKRGREEAPVAEPTAPDAIRTILDAWSNKEYFRLLGLPEPTVDDLGRPLWPCSASDVSRAYRRLSVVVHPDKNPGDDARQAFEALNEAHRLLKDPGSLEAALRDAAVRARQLQERTEARATGSERIELNVAKSGRARVMRKAEGQSFSDEIVRQMRVRQEAARKKAGGGCSRRRQDGGSDDGGGSDGDAGGGAGGSGRPDAGPPGASQAGQRQQGSGAGAAAGGRPAPPPAGAGQGGRGSVRDEDDEGERSQVHRTKLRKKPMFI